MRYRVWRARPSRLEVEKKREERSREGESAENTLEPGGWFRVFFLAATLFFFRFVVGCPVVVSGYDCLVQVKNSGSLLEKDGGAHSSLGIIVGSLLCCSRFGWRKAFHASASLSLFSRTTRNVSLLCEKRVGGTQDGAEDEGFGLRKARTAL